MPELLLPRCKADESLIAHLIVSKYVDHLPLNRMESTLERSGIRTLTEIRLTITESG